MAGSLGRPGHRSSRGCRGYEGDSGFLARGSWVMGFALRQFVVVSCLHGLELSWGSGRSLGDGFGPAMSIFFLLFYLHTIPGLLLSGLTKGLSPCQLTHILFYPLLSPTIYSLMNRRFYLSSDIPRGTLGTRPWPKPLPFILNIEGFSQCQ